MAESMVSTIRVEMIADLTSPWCYIGKRRLEQVVASFAGLDIDLHWRPFQTDPKLPEDGLELAAYRKKLGNEAEAAQHQRDATQAARAVGLNILWDKITRMPNTRDGHRLIRHAVLYGIEMKVAERLFKAYFCEGADIGSRSRLIDLAEEAGIDRYAAEALFASQEDIFAIEEDIAKTRHFILPNLPCFILADEIVVPADATEELLTAALFRAQTLPGPDVLPG